jgi:glycine/D-amino acid oxidase-like deaminating enzyme
MGLSVARLLQDRGYGVTIYAKDLPPQTTSNVAGAEWSPFSVHNADKITPAYRQQFERATRLSHRSFQDYIGVHYGVRWIEEYLLRDEEGPPRRGPSSGFFPGGAELSPEEHPFSVPFVRRQSTMFIEPTVYLSALMRDYLLRGGTIVVRDFENVRDITTLAEPVIVNCTGLGSRKLFGDEELVPLKGQLAFLLPQLDVDYIVIRGDFYMFPRSDGILLGGSKESGEWSTETTPAVIDRIFEAHVNIFSNFRS